MPDAGEPLMQLSAWFGNRAKELRAVRQPFLAASKIAIVSDARRNIDQSTSPDGIAYAPLAFPRARGGVKPLRDRGILWASLGHGPGHVEGMGEGWLEVGTNVPGAATQQGGALVFPVRAKFLAIPKTPAAARAGSPRYFPGALKVIIGRSRTGGVLKDEAGTVHYALTSLPVVVPARPFLGFGRRLIETILGIGERLLTKASGKAGG